MTSCPHCGCDIDAKPRRGKPRSVPQHRRYFAMIKAAFEHWPHDHRFTPMNDEHLRKWLQAKAGYFDVRTVETAGMSADDAIIAVAASLVAASKENKDPYQFPKAIKGKFYIFSSKSASFNDLPHLDACALSDAVAQVIEAETGLEVSKIMPPISEKRGKVEMRAEVPL